MSTPTSSSRSTVTLFGDVVIDIQGQYVIAAQAIDAKRVAHHKDIVDLICRSGGPLGNNYANLQVLTRLSNEFWQFVFGSISELTWYFKIKFYTAFATLEQVDSLIVDQPRVRSWLREFRDLCKIGRDRNFKSLQARTLQSARLVEQYQIQLLNLIKTGQCQDRDALNDRFYVILDVFFGEFDDIIKQLWVDQSATTTYIFRHGSSLNKLIFDAQVNALKHLVT